MFLLWIKDLLRRSGRRKFSEMYGKYYVYSPHIQKTSKKKRKHTQQKNAGPGPVRTTIPQRTPMVKRDVVCSLLLDPWKATGHTSFKSCIRLYRDLLETI